MELHGGNIYDKQVNVDFSVSVNPKGMPDRVQREATRGVELSEHYPDLYHRLLLERLARFYQTAEERFAVGNGASELIYVLARMLKPGRALIVGPTFVEYERALELEDCQIEYDLAAKEDEFAVGESVMERLNKEQYDMVFLCNPNNPTGQLIDPALMQRIRERCEAQHCYLIVDECFMDFVKVAEQHTQVSCLETCPHMIILKAFTKTYAMPGLRVGYAMSGNIELIRRLRRMLPPWNISISAHLAGVAALRERTYVQESKELIGAERSWLVHQLTQLGYRSYPSEANFLLFEGEEDLQEYCLSHCVLIRDAGSFLGLRKGFYRIAVKKRSENEQLIQLLRRFREERTV